MTAYRYAGDHPVPDGQGGMARPGQIFAEQPEGFGPWEELDGEWDEATGLQYEPDAEPPAAPAPAAAKASAKAAPAASGTGGEG